MIFGQGDLRELIESRLRNFRVLVVANREPYIHIYKNGSPHCILPASGMASALDPVMRACGGTWVAHGSGEADRDVVDEHDRVRVPPEDPSYTLRRVWLTPEQEEGYYYGLANGGLWPLCHIAFTRPLFDPRDWESYREVNRLFADAVLEEAGAEPAFVFIQDYHFGLLPRLLKQANPGSSSPSSGTSPGPTARSSAPSPGTRSCSTACWATTCSASTSTTTARTSSTPSTGGSRPASIPTGSRSTAAAAARWSGRSPSASTSRRTTGRLAATGSRLPWTAGAGS